MPSIEEQLDALAIDDNLQRVENPLATGWAILTGYAKIGEVQANGWRSPDAFGAGEEAVTGAGARYTVQNGGTDNGELGPVAKLQVGVLTSTLRYFAVNLRLAIINSYGVRAKFIETASGVWTLRLEDWVEGVRSVLTEVPGVTIAAGGQAAVYVLGAQACVWVKPSEGGEWEQVAEEEVGEGGGLIQAWAAQGGIDACGNIGRYKNFAVGQIELPPSEPEPTAPPDVRILRETRPDLDRLAMIVESPDGFIRRWSDAEPDVENIPLDLDFSSSVPGGDADAGCGLLRDMAFRARDLRGRNRVRIQGPGADTTWRGYLVKTPDTKTQVSPAAVGDVGKLKGDPSLQMIGVDRDYSHWTAPSNQRQLKLIEGNTAHKEDPQVVSDSQGKALMLTLRQPWAAPYQPRSEAFYDARGIPIGRLLFKWSNGGMLTADLFRHVFEDDLGGYGAGSFEGGDVYSGTSGSTDFVPTKALYPYAQIAWRDDATPGGVDGQEYPVRIYDLAIYGRDIPQSVDPATGIPGVTGPDTLRAILDKAGGGITYDADSIEANGWVIPHLVWLDPITPEQGILDVNRFFRNLWGVYNGKLRWAAPESFGKLWHVRRDEGADPQFNGPDSDQEYNGFMVSYDDALSGRQELVGPPASGLTGPTGLSTATLADLDPFLPLNEWGERKWAKVEAGLTSEAGAIRLGELFRAGLRDRLTSGSIEIGAWQVYDDTGARYPAWAPKAGDRIIVDDEPNAAERLIVEASYRHASRSASLTLDSPPDALEALQERLQVVLVGVVD